MYYKAYIKFIQKCIFNCRVFTNLLHNKSTIPALFTAIIIAIVIIFSSFSSISEPFPLFSHQQQQKAYADGLTAENLPPATVGDREAGLFVKINPAILTSESQENAFLQFRLFDERNNETIQHVTYDISIRRANASEDLGLFCESSSMLIMVY